MDGDILIETNTLVLAGSLLAAGYIPTIDPRASGSGDGGGDDSSPTQRWSDN